MKTFISRKRRGQNTVEYLLMLAVVVGVVLLSGMAIKRYIPTLFNNVADSMSKAAHSLGSSGGNIE